ncbi:MAG: DUF951 domain-containing protein [Chloroflexota bacterium]|nr:DUF951 domain-containing protein [Chloroflexota bacterium]
MKRVDVQVDDIVTLRKPHPCGGYRWRVTRIGADIGLKCLTCGRHIMMPRSKFNRSAKEVVSPRSEPPEG